MKTKYYTFLDGDSGNICGTVTLNDENKSTFFERCKKCLECHFDEDIELNDVDLMESISLYESDYKGSIELKGVSFNVLLSETWIY